jgi:hypothetical protein
MSTKKSGRRGETELERCNKRKRVDWPPPDEFELGAFDLGELFARERARVDGQLATLRVQIARLQPPPEDRDAGATAAAQPTETANKLPVGHPLETFVSDCLNVSGTWAEAGCGAVSRAYKKWCLSHDEHKPFNHITFARIMSKHFPRHGCVNRVVYTCMTLKAAPGSLPPMPSKTTCVEGSGPPSEGAGDSEDIGSEDSDSSTRSGASEEYQRHADGYGCKPALTGDYVNEERSEMGLD